MKLSRRSRRRLLLPGAIALIAVLALSTPLASARIYSDYDRHDWWCWWWHSYWTLSLKIDTSANTLTLKAVEVEGIFGNQINPWNTYFKVWDKDGIIFQHGPGCYRQMREGQWTLRYSKNYRWVYAEAHWSYWLWGLGPTYEVGLHCAVYVGY